MSLLRSPKLRSLRSTIESIRDRLAGKPRQAGRQLKPRRLAVDPLEERVLLSVVPADYDDVLVNQITSTETQGTISAQSVAVDNDGDFVVAWTRYDEYLATNPLTGASSLETDANVYARYFTDEVQRITLPDSVTADTDSNDFGGSFSLTYGGNELQKLELSTTTVPNTAPFGATSSMAGSIVLGFDVDGNGVVIPGETTTVVFDEATEDFTEIAGNIQTQLRGLGGALNDVTVQGINPHEYYIQFGDLSLGEDQPQITVESSAFSSGFLPAAITSTVREPIEIGSIPVSADDPELTAYAIELMFSFTNEDTLTPPTVLPPNDPARWGTTGPYVTPDVTEVGAAEVSVTPVWEQQYDPITGDPVLNADGLPVVAPSTTKFDVTFIGDSGKKDQPLLVVSEVLDESGADITGDLDPDPVTTLKEPSPEFRVNPGEPNNPGTPGLLDRYDQKRADVAIDADGDFVITWESEVPAPDRGGSVSDVFARRFSPVPVVEPGTEAFRVDTDFDGIADTGVQGVVPTSPAFRVNTSTAGAQGQPAVGMDATGNFTIAWGSGTEGLEDVLPGQDFSYFNNVHARQYDRFGDPVDDQFQVNTEVTEIHFDPYVAASDDGNVAIAWNDTNDENILDGGVVTLNLALTLYDQTGNTLITPISVGGAGSPAVAWDGANNFVVSWDQLGDSDNTGGGSEGVRAVQYELVPSGSATGWSLNQTRSTFRANSSDFNPGSNPFWPGFQGNAQPALDEDGDLVIAYEGVGGDVSEDTFLDTTAQRRLFELFNDPQNTDLLAYFNPDNPDAPPEEPPGEFFPLRSSYFSSSLGRFVFPGSTNEIDTDIENLLLRASDQGASDQQLGRIRALVEEVVGLLRGEGWGVMYSSFDTDVQSGNSNRLYSDSVANAHRDGNNERWVLTIPTTAEGGDFNIRLWNAYTSGFEDIDISPVFRNDRLITGETRDVIENELEAATRTGTNWPERAPYYYEAPVEVRLVASGFGFLDSEIEVRENTPWEWNVDADEAVYEIVFQGEVHDSYIGLGLRDIDLDFPDGVPSRPPRLINIQNYSQGTTQDEVSIGMETDGDFTMVWTQAEEHTFGGVSNYNIYYRRFDETTDTAGPSVTDGFGPDGLPLEREDPLDHSVNYVVLTFDEQLMMGDPLVNPDSALNPENYALYQNNVQLPGGIAKVEFGLNKAAELAGQDDGFGGTYPIAWAASNKWEAVLTLDGDLGLSEEITPLGNGTYTVVALAPDDVLGTSGLHDVNQQPLGGSGYLAGEDFSLDFTVELAGDQDDPIDPGTGGGVSAPMENGHTHPETANAVASDADGDYAVVWTAYDPFQQHERVYMRLFDADGTAADLPLVDNSGAPILSGGEVQVVEDAFPALPVTPFDWTPGFDEFQGDVQGYGSVAMDADGDFVITWTNYTDGGDGDVYVRQFDALGGLAGINQFGVPVFASDADEAVLVNTGYTQDDQKWSDVAMDADGDFVVAWSSYGQEDGPDQLGSGYGVYARRYDWLGQAQGPEFLVNVTTGGNQKFPSVAMDAPGGFVVAWTSDVDDQGADIIARSYWPDGSPQATTVQSSTQPTAYLQGEVLISGTGAAGALGDQDFPDVAMNATGTSYVVTWDGPGTGPDTSNTAVFARQVQRNIDRQAVVDLNFSANIPPTGVAIPSVTNPPVPGASPAFTYTLNVPSAFVIDDLDVELDIQHPRVSDLTITLSKGGTEVVLVNRRPRDASGNYLDGADFTDTIFDDEALTDIGAGVAPALPPFTGSFRTEESLAAFEGQASNGTWTLTIYDATASGWPPPGEPDAFLLGWSMQFQSAVQMSQIAQVNTSALNEQAFSSVAMDAQGNFVVTWSGRGDQLGQEDLSGSGVFYQRYDGSFNAVGTETRVNRQTVGEQRYASVSSDGDGDFVVVWTGPEIDPGTGAVLDTTSIYKFDSVGRMSQPNRAAPMVTEVLASGRRIFEGDALTIAESKEISLVLTELMSTRQEDTDGDGIPDHPRADSILNPANWKVQRNGTVIPGAIEDIEFAWNPLSRSYEATVTLADSLGEGEYVLTLFDGVMDDPQNTLLTQQALDGDLNGAAGEDFTIAYVVVSDDARFGPETRVNEETAPRQTFSEPRGTGLGYEQSTRAVAVDHDGDFAVVWTSYEQGDGDAADVYMRLYDRDDEPLTPEVRVNTYLTGDQRNAGVAMDADGDFLVVWESQGQDQDGSWGIYGQWFDAAGNPIGTEFQVNTEYTGDQLNPAVGMSNSGDAVVVWATRGQPYSYFNNVHGQRFDRTGDPVGLEFQVNSTDIPGTSITPGSIEVNPAVAMDRTGGFVVAWDQITQQINGEEYDSVIVGRLFDNGAAPLTGEFRVDDGSATLSDPEHVTEDTSGGTETHDESRNPQIAMDDAGNFIIAWEAWRDNDIDGATGPESYGVYFRRFNPDGSPDMGADHQANLVITSFNAANTLDDWRNAPDFAFEQVNASVAMDADGDYQVVWNGNGAQPSAIDPDEGITTQSDSAGVWIRSFHADDPQNNVEFVSVQSRVNRTEGGIQQFPSIGMEPDGDSVVVWSGAGVGDRSGIFFRRYDESTDTAGPLATELRTVDGDLVLNDESMPVDDPDKIVVVFDEQMWMTGDDSVENPDNWVLRRDNVPLDDAIADIVFTLNPATNKWEAEIEFTRSLLPGHYTLTALHPVPDIPDTTPDEGQSGLRDAAGNPLSKTAYVPAGADISQQFYVTNQVPEEQVSGAASATTYALDNGATALDFDGDQVVVYTQKVGGVNKIMARLYEPDRDGDGVTAVGAGFEVTADDTAFDDDQQRYGSVALDADGDFVVTWTNYRDGEADVYARVFASDGTAQGDAFLVHAYTEGEQNWPDVAMDPQGDFVVTWSSYGQENGGDAGSLWGVYGRQFNRFGDPQGGAFQVNVTTGGNQRFAAVDVADSGDFVIVWQSDQNGVGQDIVGRMYYPDGSPRTGPLSGERLMNEGSTDGNQRYPDVGINPAGTDFTVIWTSTHNDGSGDGVFGRTVNVERLEETGLEDPMVYTWTGNGPFGFGNTFVATIDVPFDAPLNSFLISDVNATVNINHGLTGDVELTLVSPGGTRVSLVENEPDVGVASSDFQDTIFDDEQPIAITDTAETGPYNNPLGYQPEGLGAGEGLHLYDGQNSSGTWQLIVQDTVLWDLNGDGRDDVTGTLNLFELEITRTPAMGDVFRVNESTLGNQSHASITMDRQGAFTVVWSGAGDQLNDEDDSGSFFRQFDVTATPAGDETRVNKITDGEQSKASIGGDAIGNFGVVWTGDVPGMPGQTAVYRAKSTDFVSVTDNDGPVVSDVVLPSGQPLLQNDVVYQNELITELTVYFSEDLSVRGGETGPDSVLNPDNWLLQRNGTQVQDAVTKVDFSFNPAIRKYEAVVSLDASAIGAGTTALPAGNYVLTVRDTIKDNYDPKAELTPDDPFDEGNALDGDFDGSPGTLASDTGYNGYAHEFTVLDAQDAIESLVNGLDHRSLQQTFSEPLGTGYGREQSTTSLAVDHDGDYVVVWTSYGQDNPADFNSGGIYMRLFDRDDQPLTPEILVTDEDPTADQRNAAVALDADGDIVVTWEAQGDNVDNSWGVYARRYNSVGDALDSAFLVNTNVQNDQLNPSVAMDHWGNFVVVWATKGQAYSYFNDVHGQLYNYKGEEIGSEFVVNSTGVPGTLTGPGNVDLNPAVAMNSDGRFVVAWDQITAQQNGVITDSEIRARVYEFQADGALADIDGDGVEDPEFPVGDGIGDPGDPDWGRTARNPQAAMDDQGGFIVTWESYIDAVNAQYDVFFEQFDSAGAVLINGQANQAVDDPDDPEDPAAGIYGGQQVNPSVSADADGDFAIVWNGQGARPDALDPNNPNFVSQRDEEGVFVRSWNSATQIVSVQSRVNYTERGIQQFPTVGMEPDGDYVVAWSGTGIGDNNGIYTRRYDEATDTAGPTVSDITRISGERIDGEQVTGTLEHIVVVFDEEMMAGDPALVADSVLNPANYTLMKDGAVIIDGIQSIEFGLNKASELFPAQADPTNKWEAVIVIDGNGPASGVVPLESGHYEIVISGTLRDKVGNPLGSSGLNPYGEDATGEFDVFGFVDTGGPEEQVNDITAGDQVLVGDTGAEYAPRAVASDGDGEFVIVWTDTTAGGVYAKVYNDLRWTEAAAQRVSTGPVPDGAFAVTDDATARFASVARDSDGDFVVTWEQNDGSSADPDWNVWARRYDAEGRPFGESFRVNSVFEGQQRYAAVAMDVDGDFVVTWQSNDPLADLEGRARDDDGYGIYAQRYTAAGLPLSGTDEVQVLTFIESPSGTFTLQWDGDNDAATANITAPISIDGNPAGSVQQIEDQLNALGGDVNRVEVQATSLTEVVISFVDQSVAQNQDQITVASTNFADPTSDVVAGTLQDGYSGEFLINETTANNQIHPSVDMDSDGQFVISWTSFGQDGDAPNESNIYAKKFMSNDAFRYQANNPGTTDYDYNAREQYPDIYFAVSADSPDNHIVSPGAGYDGVVQVIDPLTGGSGTGSVLSTGRHILTAAHVVDVGGGQVAPMMLIQFDTPSGPTVMAATEMYIHPGWNGDIFNANDLAIIVLPEEAPAEAQRYDIYRGSDELNQVVDMVGYGVPGQGAEDLAAFDGLKRQEKNVYEAYGDRLNGRSLIDFAAGAGSFDIPTGTLLVYDFDSGLKENDALGMVLGIGDLGLSEEEGTSSHGDSGGPAFINGQIAGVVSGGVEYAPADSDDITFNVSYGTVGFHTRVSAYADWIDMIAQSTSGEFLVNDVPLDPATGEPLASGNQKWSSVALDADGDFAITWTDELRAPDPNKHLDVMAKRFNADTSEFEVTDPATGVAAPLGQFQVNTVGDAERSQIAMDADGDFVIVWGNKAQRYARNDLVGVEAYLGPNGEIGGNVDVFTGGPGLYASVAMDDTGDAVFVREGYDDTSVSPASLGIFYKRYEAPEDVAGPMVADVMNVVELGGQAELEQLTDGITLEASPSRFIVSFSENVIGDSPSFLDSITNPDNWILTRNGEVLRTGVSSIEYGLNQSSAGASPILPGPSNKYEAVITLDGDPDRAGDQPLPGGTYLLTIRNYVEDQFGNRLDGAQVGSPNSNFRRSFTVSHAAGGPIDEDARIGDADPGEEDDLVHFDFAGDQQDPAVAMDAEGNYVVAWVETTDTLDADDELIGTDSNIKARRFDAFGDPIGGEFVVNSYRTGEQVEPAVAMNENGSFVVTWSGQGEADDQGTVELVGVFARVFDAFAQPVDEQFMVNQSGDARRFPQRAPSVAMDERGDFAVTWTSYGQDGDRDGVYARRYDFLGQAKGKEFLVNTVTAERQSESDIAMDQDGNFVIVWSAYAHPGDGSEWGVFGQRYNASGKAVGGEFYVNPYTLDDQTDAHVAMDDDGNFAVVWASDIQDGSDWGVYGRLYNANGAAEGGAFRVNQTTLHYQYQPDVAMAGDGDFVVTWTTVGQDNPDAQDRGIYARAYNADGSNFVDPDTGRAVREFLVNSRVGGHQVDSAVAMDADGDFAIVWSGPDDDLNGVYHRQVRVNEVPPASGPSGPGGAGDVYYALGANASTSTVLRLEGTPGDDKVEFHAGVTAATSSIVINGVRYPVGSSVRSIRFDGLGGYDHVVIFGTALDETVDLWPDHASFSASRYNVSVDNVERTYAIGGGGTDFAALHDDPASVDTLRATPTQTKLYSDGFYIAAKSFSYVRAYATLGGGDVALLYDDPYGADTFKGWAGAAKLYGDGYFNQATGFTTTIAIGTPGSGDGASLFGKPGSADTFKASPDDARFYGEGFYNVAKSFDGTVAVATKGDGDVAILYDDPDGKDTFKALPTQARLYGDGFHNVAKGFDTAIGVATPGQGDVALLYDQAGARDTFRAWPTTARLYGEGYYSKANSFDVVIGVATEGDGDVAMLYDDPSGADELRALPNEVKLYGDGFYNRASGFYATYAAATPGGGDVARLYDSPAKDTLVATPETVRLYNGTYSNKTAGFGTVAAYSTDEGYDTAYLYDSALEEFPDHLEADANWARLSNELLGYAYFASDFEEVVATRSNASDTEDVNTEALDFLFTSEQNW